ncbi:hypothetical protein ACJX0J_016477, partial [Zea mays]
DRLDVGLMIEDLLTGHMPHHGDYCASTGLTTVGGRNDLGGSVDSIIMHASCLKTILINFPPYGDMYTVILYMRNVGTIPILYHYILVIMLYFSQMTRAHDSAITALVNATVDNTRFLREMAGNQFH